MKKAINFGAYRHKPLFRGLIFLVLAGIFFWAGVSAVLRIKSESRNKTVEISLDWDEVNTVCALNGYPVGDFLERCRAIGAASVVLREETLNSLSTAGKIVYFPVADYSRANLLDIITQGGMVSNNLIASKDQAEAKNLSDILQARYGIGVKTQKGGKYYLVYPAIDPLLKPDFWNDNAPLGFSSDKINFLSAMGFKTVYRVQNSGNPVWITRLSTENASGFIWDGAEVPGYPGREKELCSALEEKKLKYANIEFNPLAGEGTIEARCPGLLVRGHTVSEIELGRNKNPAFWLSRWTRAIKERNIRFIYFRFWKNMTVEDNLSYLRTVAMNIKDSGFSLGTAEAPGYPARGMLVFWMFCALVISVAAPLAGLKISLGRANFIVSFLTMNGISILGGLLISAMLYDAYFMQKMIEIPFVRLFFFLPILLSVFILFKPEYLRGLWNTKLEVKHLVIAAGVLTVGAVIFVRSGNGAAEWMVPDQSFRQMLENVLMVRPRTKEFIIGQPLLLLGFYSRNPWLILAGMIGQASVLNTFMHAHSPLWMSLMRTVHGLVLGTALGFALIAAYKAFKSRSSNKY